MNEEEIAQILEKERNRGNLKELTSHDQCGAAAIYTKEHDLNPKRSDMHGMKFAKRMAKRLGLRYRHITIDEMDRPSGVHDARIVYVDGTGRFNPKKIAGMPKGLVISRSYLSPQEAAGQTRLAIEIALGNHGMGELITRESPLVIIPIGDPRSSETSILKLREECSRFEKAYNGRIIVSGFSAPV